MDHYITLEDIPIIIKIAISTTNRDRVSIIKLLLTATRRDDDSGKRVHKTKFYTSDLIQELKFSPSTARRTMMELQLLELVRLQNEINPNNNRRKYYIELDPAFKWLLNKPFQDLIKDFNWKQVIDEKEKEKEQEEKERRDHQNGRGDDATTTSTTTTDNSIHRKYPGTDIWECLKCKIYVIAWNLVDKRFMLIHNKIFTDIWECLKCKIYVIAWNLVDKRFMLIHNKIFYS